MNQTGKAMWCSRWVWAGLLLIGTTVPVMGQGNRNFVDALDLDPADVVALDFGNSDPAGFGIFETAAVSFPRAGGTYVILNTGDVREALSGDQSNGLSSSLQGLNTNANEDLVQMTLRLRIPSGQNALRFDWKYVSEEFPNFVGGSFNDGFLAELNASTFTIEGADIIAPNNVAFDPNDNIISVNATGALTMSADQAVGTSFNGGTPALTSTIGLPRNASEVTIIFSVFDVGDSRFDSGIMLDNIRFTQSQDEGTTTASDLEVVVAEDEVRAGQDIRIEVTPPVRFGSATGEVFFRNNPSQAYSSSPLTLQNNNTFAGTIPAALANEVGVQYHVSLSNNQQVLTFPGLAPEENPAFIPVFLDRFTSPVAPSPGLYRMVSAPLNIEDGAIQSVLSDDYGDFDDEVWRLFLINSPTDTYIPGFVLGEGFSPGRAFWLTTASGGRFDVEEAAAVNSTKAVTIRLEPGWNQIGNPFAFPVTWESVDNRGGVEDPVFWNGAEYQFNQLVLEPWEGYFVFNTSSRPVDLKVQPNPSNIGHAKTSEVPSFLDQAGYALRLSAHASNHPLIDTQNYVGFTSATSPVAVHEAPPPGDHIRLSIMDQGNRMAASLVPTPAGGASWDLTLDHHLENNPFALRKRVQLGFSETGTRPEGMDLYLFDLDAGHLLSRDGQPVELNLSEAAPLRLRVVVGTEAFATQAGEGIALVPARFRLAQNFPNPFTRATRIAYDVGTPAEVRLTLYNALGQLVRTLVQQQQEAGTYTVTWDGRDDAGRPVSSGFYLYRLEAAGAVQTRTLSLLR